MNQLKIKLHTRIKSLILCCMDLSFKNRISIIYTGQSIHFTPISIIDCMFKQFGSAEITFIEQSACRTWIYNVILRGDIVTCQCKSNTLTNGPCQRKVARLGSIWQSQQNTLHYSEIYPPINHINIGWRATLRFNPTVNQKSTYHTSPGNEVDTVWQYKALSYIRQFTFSNKLK